MHPSLLIKPAEWCLGLIEPSTAEIAMGWDTLFNFSSTTCSDNSPPSNNSVYYTPPETDQSVAQNYQVQCEHENKLTILVGQVSLSPGSTPKAKPVVVVGKLQKNYFKLLQEGECELELIQTENKSSLVVAHERTSDEIGRTVLNRPVFLFPNGSNWKSIANTVLSRVPGHGIYLLSFKWKFKSTYLRASGQLYQPKQAPVLHCVCKEPENRFRGRIGPINTFVPHQETTGRMVNGIWVGLLDHIHSGYAIHEHHLDTGEYYSQLKQISPQLNRVMFFVAKDGACVGMQVMHTKPEEIALRKLHQHEHHHERPLILENGFYLLEGIFETNFLNSNNNAKINAQEFREASSPKVVIIGEGTHLIRTNTEMLTTNKAESGKVSQEKSIMKDSSVKNIKMFNLPEHKTNDSRQTKQTKIRRVEVCLDCQYSSVIVLDYQQLQLDFSFTVNTPESTGTHVK